jgi:hypothetical protein
MLSSFSNISSMVRNVKRNVIIVISSIFSNTDTVSSISYNGTPVSSYSGSITSGNMIISGTDAINNYNVYAFGASGQTYVINYTFTGSPTTAYILAVGGGGGGGSYGGGGGGGGGVVMTPITINPSVGTITITVGRGGTANTTGSVNWQLQPNYTTTTPAGLNTDGSNTTINFAVTSGSLPTISSTSISNITAYGGGRGAANNYFVGNSGGSGGGGGYSGIAAGSANNYNSNPYINYASNGSLNNTIVGGAGASGGGAGAVSIDGAQGGYGKQTLSTLLGIANFTPTGYSNFGNYYWGGGGAGSQGATASGGWGGGGGTTNNGTIGVGDNKGITNSTAGTGANTLSGAGGQGTGGGGAGGNNIYGGNGGSGIVIIAFPITSNTKGLKIYLTFDSAVSSTGGTYSSGVIYIPNLAPGANNTSDTTGSLFKGWVVAPNVQLSNTIFKNGNNSIYMNNLLLRNNNNTSTRYIFPANTGLSFSIWANLINRQGFHGALFSFADTSGGNTVSLKLNPSTTSNPSSTGPWYLYYQVDDNKGTANNAGFYVDPTKTKNPINPKTWNHFAWVISPAAYGALTTYTFYINGEQVASINNSGLGTIYPINNSRIFIDIGAQAGFSGINGYFDTFRYYERNLSSNEISNIYNISDRANSISVSSNAFLSTQSLKLYLTFDSSVNSTGGPYTSGTVYVSNLAPGADNTGITSGTLFSTQGAGTTLSIANVKWGNSSLIIGSGGGAVFNTNPNFIFPSNTGLTFTIWANLSIRSGFSIAPLFGRIDLSNNYTTLRLSGSTAPWTNLNYQVDDSVAPPGGGINVSTGSISIAANTWYHYAWTISPAASGATTCTHTFYINGVALTPVTGKYPQNINMSSFVAGGQPSYGAASGYFDTFRYYERTLSSLEISNIYSVFDPSNSIGSLSGPFTTSSLNIISWYNPENVSSNSGGVVTGWNDSLGINNFTTASGTINVVTYNGYKILYSPPLSSPNIGPYLDGPNATGKSLGGILFGYQDISLNQEGNYLSCLFGNRTSDLGMRFIASPTNYGLTSASDFTSGTGGAIYTNSLLVTDANGNLNTTGNLIPTTVPTTYNTQYSKFSNVNQTTVTNIRLISYFNGLRTFFGYLSDLFIVNTSFTDANRQVLEGYIAYKLGSQSRLPTSHPYYSATNSIPVTIEVPSIVFKNNCSSLTGWTNNGFSVSTVGGQTCFRGTVNNNYIYIDTRVASLKGCSINFDVYLTGGCPDFFFACDSSGAGQFLRFEQRSGATNQNGFSVTTNWTTWPNLGLLTSTYSWPQNTWTAVSLSISFAGVATFSVNGVPSGITYNITDNGGYIGIQVDGAGGSISVNNIIVNTIDNRFIPISVSGLNLWFDASDISGNGTTVTNGTLINKWFDKSGLGNHATANANITYNSTGLNSRPALSFTGTQWLTGNVTNNNNTMSLFVVFSMNSTSSSYARTIGFSSGSGVHDSNNNNFLAFARNNSFGMQPWRNNATISNILPNYSTPYLSECWFDGSSGYATSQKGESTTINNMASSGNFAISYFTIANNPNTADGSYLNGFISEILVYNTNLTTSDRQKVEGYLSWKWGLQGNLPSSHPYYISPP